MRLSKVTLLLAGCSYLGACQAVPKAPPTQVVYRFDDHRYLELAGFNCEGALWYTDTKLGIHTEVEEQFYKIFTKKYVHPSERYIAITEYEGSGFYISKDYGRTWDGARYSPGGGVDPDGDNKPQREEIDSFTVVNDQGFMLTKKGDIYLSSKPFDEPNTHGGKWGKDYISLKALQDYRSTLADRKNFQDLPNKVPEVKNYTGWDHMRCDPDLGLPASEKGK